MLSESEVRRSFQQLFNRDSLDSDAFERAEELLDELNPENPLRHRLSMELEELRKIHV